MAFRVLVSPAFARLYGKLKRKHRELAATYAEALGVLADDPFNRSSKHNIRKLTNVAQGEGLYRLRIGRWRFRYDIYGSEVLLSYCGLRREDTYSR